MVLVIIKKHTHGDDKSRLAFNRKFAKIRRRRIPIETPFNMPGKIG